LVATIQVTTPMISASVGTKRLLGAGYMFVDADLKDAPTGPPRCHLRIWSNLW